MNVSKSSHKPPSGTKSPAALPRWIEESEIGTASPEELLLFFAAGGKGERHRENPLAAMAERLAAKARALHVLGAIGVDDQDVHDLLQELAEQIGVLAAFVARGV